MSPFHTMRALGLRSIPYFSKAYHSTKVSSSFFSPSISSATVSSIGLRPQGLQSLNYSGAKSISRRSFASGARRDLPPFQGPTNMRLLYGLMGVNVGVFLYYQYLSEQARQGIRKPLVDWFNNFTLSYNGVKDQGRWWTLLTNTFAHMGPFHIAGNMISVYYFGQLVANTPGIGPGRLLTLVLGAGLAGSAGYIYQQGQKLRATGQQTSYDRCLGFSGSVMGVGAVAACLYPKTTFLIYGIIPMPLWALIGGYMLYDGFYLNQKNTRVGHAGHLGGLAFGLVYYFARLRGVTLPGRPF